MAGGAKERRRSNPDLRNYAKVLFLLGQRTENHPDPMITVWLRLL